MLKVSIDGGSVDNSRGGGNDKKIVMLSVLVMAVMEMTLEVAITGAVLAMVVMDMTLMVTMMVAMLRIVVIIMRFIVTVMVVVVVMILMKMLMNDTDFEDDENCEK